MSLRLRVLGSGPAWPSPGRACTGFLIETGELRVLLDCGTGVFERLRAVMPPEDLSAVIISHLHFDHFADLMPFRYYLLFGSGRRASLPLFLPPGAAERLRRVVEPVEPSPGFFKDAFRVSEYDPDSTLRLGKVRISFHKTLHPVDTYAFRISLGGAALVYSADTGWDPSLAGFATGADLFLCEAGWGTDGRSAEGMHLSAAEAGLLARMAGARRLLLTHIPGPEAPSVAAARAEFGGPAEHAGPGEVFRI
ncbi:MBL fold metallo-hydrolase [Rubrobacter taiwanensis]|uniref:MBL fold metallo-hydrolase n=1 Tax=Rubrobacter taiwanensis TaxID=185139 RepID=A0A4R1BRJ6_9ACTN|nr:MBL fold metallo-hydrolase [Rubrobacter taiwanensis]TCJ19825.1 MBL fold metallo-hydrolase [Rubrobacter taiwanensis]